MSDNDKRKFRRVNKKFLVRIVQRISENEVIDLNLTKVESINVSASGLLVHVDRPIGIDSLVKVSFLKPNSFDILEIEGDVIRIENVKDGSYSLAINFLSLTAKDKRDLAYYLDLSKD